MAGSSRGCHESVAIDVGWRDNAGAYCFFISSLSSLWRLAPQSVIVGGLGWCQWHLGGSPEGQP